MSKIIDVFIDSVEDPVLRDRLRREANSVSSEKVARASRNGEIPDWLDNFVQSYMNKEKFATVDEKVNDLRQRVKLDIIHKKAEQEDIMSKVKGQITIVLDKRKGSIDDAVIFDLLKQMANMRDFVEHNKEAIYNLISELREGLGYKKFEADPQIMHDTVSKPGDKSSDSKLFEDIEKGLQGGRR